MSYLSNPYKVGAPVEGRDFYGREALLEKILWQPSRVTHLLGMRRIGKTSLLKKLATQGKAIYFNLQRTGGNWDEFNRALGRVIQRERRQFPWLTNPEIIQNCKTVFDLLEIFDDHAYEAGAQVWLLLDEAELLIELGRKNVEALPTLRSIIWEMRATQVVFASAKELTELDELTSARPYGSPFLNHFPPPIYISSLEEAAAAALIRQSRGDIPLTISDEVVQAICQRTHNHPYFIQWVCYCLWEKNHNPATWRVDDSIFKASPQLQQILKKDFDYLSDPERQIIQAILAQQALPETHWLYVEGLTALGYLRQTDRGYEIGNDFFKNWLLELNNQDWAIPSQIAAESTLRLYEKTEKQGVSVHQSDLHFLGFHVFLVHNSYDKSQVKTIAEELKRRGLSPWLDQEQIPPGRWFQDIIQQAIKEVRSAAIFIGPQGLGKWQVLELRSFIKRCVEANFPVIPVLLPGVHKIPEELLFLEELNWVSFADRIDDVEALDKLVWGITGKRP